MKMIEVSASLVCFSYKQAFKAWLGVFRKSPDLVFHIFGLEALEDWWLLAIRMFVCNLYISCLLKTTQSNNISSY